MLETDVFKYNLLIFCVAKTMLCILLKFVHLMLNKCTRAVTECFEPGYFPLYFCEEK